MGFMALIEALKGLLTGDSAFFQWYVSNGRIMLDYLHSIFDSSFYFFLYLTIAFTTVYFVLIFYSGIFDKNKKERKLDPKKAPFVTIQIPTRNEIVALRCAKRCLDFDYPKDRYEILIGDDSDKPEISAEFKRFAKKHNNVRVIARKKNVGFKPGNLNNMLRYSKGDILVLFDSDFTPENDFLKRIINPFIYDPNISAVQARWNFNNFSQNIVTILASTIVYVFHHIMLSFMSIFNTGSLCGSAEAVRKKDLIELGGWKSGSLTEDIEFSLRLHKNNKKILYLKDLQCYNDVPYIAKDLYKQQMRWAYGVVSAYKEHLVSILLSRKLGIQRKALSLFAGFGYLMPVLMLFMFITGTLSFVTHKPGPIDIPRFVSELSINIILTSGLLVATIISLYKEKKMKYAFKAFISSFSIGIITTYYVNKGIFKSILGKPMHWYLLNKDVKKTESSD